MTRYKIHEGPQEDAPSAIDRAEEIAARGDGKGLAVFLDYDGTLTPIVERPELAVMSESMRDTVRELARIAAVAIVSGRDRPDVEALVRLDSVYFAGSHGFDIAGPGGVRMQPPAAARCEPVVRRAEAELRRRLERIGGALVEGKRFAVAVHYRQVAGGQVPAVREAVNAVAASHPELRRTAGKKVLELRPRIDWDKGMAVQWLLGALSLDPSRVLSLYIGDDETDEDAFAALRDRGIGILVSASPRPTRARYALRDPGEVRVFLERLLDVRRPGRP